MQDKVVNFDVNLNKWSITNLYGNTLWVKMIDEPNAEYVMKKGLLLKTEQATRGFFRIGQILKCGNKTEHAKEQDFVLIPPHTGIMGLKDVDGFKTIFISEDKIMAVIEFDGTPEDLQENIEDTLHLNIA